MTKGTLFLIPNVLDKGQPSRVITPSVLEVVNQLRYFIVEIKSIMVLNQIWKKGVNYGEVHLGCFCAPKKCHCETIKQILLNKQEQRNQDKTNTIS